MRRTPKFFNGTAVTSKVMAEMLPAWLAQIEGSSKEPAEAVFAHWREIISAPMAPFTEPISWIEGVLTVKVKSSTLYSLLQQQEKPRLLKLLQAKFAVKNLIFRIG